MIEEKTFPKLKQPEIIPVEKHPNYYVDLHIPDPHEIFLPYFNKSNMNMMTIGNMKEFLRRAFLFITTLFVLKFIMGDTPSTILFISYILIALPFFMILVFLLPLIIKTLNDYSERSVGKFFLIFGAIIAGMIVLGKILILL